MSTFDEQKTTVIDFITNTFPDTMKEPCGCLKHPYVSPGGPYAQTLWDWDSYWTLLAIFNISEQQGDSEAIKKLAPYARGTFFNFLDHQGSDGALPILIQPDDSDPFDCLISSDNNMAKPFIAQMGLLLLKHSLLKFEDLNENIYRLRSFHQCYEKRYLHSETGLMFWAKDWGLGVDDDPAAWGRPEKSCATVFLNIFLYRDYQAAAELSEFCGRTDYAKEYHEKANRIADSLQKYCWDNREKSFFSIDVQCKTNISQHRLWGSLNFKLDTFWNCLKLKILSWSCILPFWAGIGTEEQFDAFVKENLVEDRLWSDFGVRSLSKDESMYAPEVSRGNPSNWLGPIWIVANYIVWDTLKQRGYTSKANELAKNIVALLASDLKTNGMFHEYYSPESGRGVCGENFMSWNALAGLFDQICLDEN